MASDALQTNDVERDIPMDTPVSELIGRQVRAYQAGDILPEDFVADRVNVEYSAERKIVRLWYG